LGRRLMKDTVACRETFWGSHATGSGFEPRRPGYNPKRGYGASPGAPVVLAFYRCRHDIRAVLADIAEASAAKPASALPGGVFQITQF